MSTTSFCGIIYVKHTRKSSSAPQKISRQRVLSGRMLSQSLASMTSQGRQLLATTRRINGIERSLALYTCRTSMFLSSASKPKMTKSAWTKTSQSRTCLLIQTQSCSRPSMAATVTCSLRKSSTARGSIGACKRI